MASSPSPSADAAPAVAADAATVSTSSGGACEPGKVFVGGIPFEATEDALRGCFGKYGEVTDAIIMRDRETGNPRGFGFVSFADPSAADSAIQDTAARHAILGRPVEVKRAIPRGEQHQSPRNQCYSGYQQHSRILIKGSSRTSDDGHTGTKKIFVGGLPANLTQEEFKSHFEKFGRVTDAVVMVDGATQRPRGFGFVTFESEESVGNAVQDTFQTLNGKTVEVKRAVPKAGSNGGNDFNTNSYSRSGYCPRIGSGKGSILNSCPGGTYPPYSPPFGGFHGYGALPYPLYPPYGMGGYGEGYTCGGHGVCYVPYTIPRGTWTGCGYVSARRSPMPYAAPGFYAGYINGGVNPYAGVGAGGYPGFVSSTNRKWNQSDSDSRVQAAQGTFTQVENGKQAAHGTVTQVENGKLDDQQSSEC